MLSPEIFRPLYLSLVRPILEFGLQASTPYLRQDIILIEKLQRLATRMVKGLRDLSYENRLRRLNLFSIERRLLRGDLILAYNVFQGRLDVPLEEFFEAPTERRHDFQLRHRRFHRARRGAAFSVRLPPKWNALPLEVVTAPTLDLFKRMMDDRWALLFPDIL